MRGESQLSTQSSGFDLEAFPSAPHDEGAAELIDFGGDSSPQRSARGASQPRYSANSLVTSALRSTLANGEHATERSPRMSVTICPPLKEESTAQRVWAANR